MPNPTANHPSEVHAPLHIVPLADVPHWQAVLLAWQQATWPAHSTTELQDLLQQSSAGQALPITWVALRAGQCVGSVAIHRHEMGSAQPAQREYWLGFLFVPPAARGLGVARQLMQHATDYAAQLGLETLYLYTPDLAAAYARMGWQPIQQLWFQAEWVTVMQKTLCKAQTP